MSNEHRTAQSKIPEWYWPCFDRDTKEELIKLGLHFNGKPVALQEVLKGKDNG